VLELLLYVPVYITSFHTFNVAVTSQLLLAHSNVNIAEYHHACGTRTHPHSSVNSVVHVVVKLNSHSFSGASLLSLLADKPIVDVASHPNVIAGVI
jgi:hypothetical protein